jgi:hypothetical protein
MGAQEHALREELLDFRRRLLAKPEARKASAYRVVRDMLVALGSSEDEADLRGLFDVWANDDGEVSQAGSVAQRQRWYASPSVEPDAAEHSASASRGRDGYEELEFEHDDEDDDPDDELGPDSAEGWVESISTPGSGLSDEVCSPWRGGNGGPEGS